MHLLLALDRGFESLGSVALTSYLLHHRFESVVLVTPPEQRLLQLEEVAAEFGVPLVWQPIGSEAALHRLEPGIQPYFFCIEALQQRRQAVTCTWMDTCVSGFRPWGLPLIRHPAACWSPIPTDLCSVWSLPSPMPGMLFDAPQASLISPAAGSDYLGTARCVFWRVLSQCA